MKIRNGFVSNSSSSSFIVGLPVGLDRKEKKELILSKMGVDKDSLFFIAAKEIVDCILSADKMSTIGQFMNDYGYDTLEKFRGDYPDIVKTFDRCRGREMDVFCGSASNENYEIGEQLFCEMGWKVDDEDFFIEKEAGF